MGDASITKSSNKQHSSLIFTQSTVHSYYLYSSLNIFANQLRYSSIEAPRVGENSKGML